MAKIVLNVNVFMNRTTSRRCPLWDVQHVDNNEDGGEKKFYYPGA